MGESQKIMQVRSARQVPVRVRLLDDDVFNHSVDKRAVGWILFDKVCEHLNVIEKDYFGMNYFDATGEKYWLNNDKKIAKQMKGQNWDFNFEVKFYPADPSQLAEDLTRYQLCLQIRRDIVNERLPCSFVTYTLLGSYTAQSELGDYDTEEFGSGYKYLKDIQFAPHQDKELLIKIAELHRQHKGQTPEESEVHFLENSKKLAMFGVELHPAKDAEGKDIQIGVCASGLIVYKDKQQINRFVWPKVLKISYRRNKYYIKIRPGEFEEFASLIGFKLSSVKFAKRLWKISVEHHSFFRFREPEVQKTTSLLPRFGSRFRYSGRTQFQTRQVVAEENRDSPYFDRVLSKRGTFSGRTDNMRKRDEDRQKRRDDMRRQPYPPQTKLPPSESPSKPPPEPKRTPPEPKHAPPVAPKPEKPKPSPRGPSSVDDNASLDRGSLNDSFDDVPDRRSKMEKIHAVATPLAALMQSKKEHEVHAEEHRRDEESSHHDQQEDDHDQSFEHEVGKSSQTNPTNSAYKSDRISQGNGDKYANIRKSKSTLGKLGSSKNYVFSYPASSFESITSHGDYNASNDCLSELKSTSGSMQNLANMHSHDQMPNCESLLHSTSAEMVYSDIPKTIYAEIGPPPTEGIYAEINEIKSQVDKLRNTKSNDDCEYPEIHNKSGKQPKQITKPFKHSKIHGRRSKFFKENQSSKSVDNSESLENKSEIAPTSKYKVKNDSKSKTMLEPKNKTFNKPDNFKDPRIHVQHNTMQMPVYAKINKHNRVNKDQPVKSSTKDDDVIMENQSFLSLRSNESTKLKEELKMYILTPEKVNSRNSVSKDNIEPKKPDAPVTALHETCKNRYDEHSTHNVALEPSGQELHDKAFRIQSYVNEPETKDGQLTTESPALQHEKEQIEILRDGSQESVSVDAPVKVLSLSSLEDMESVHYTSSVVSEPEQMLISDFETEDIELDIRKRVAGNSLSSLYKLTFDGISNNGTDSLQLGDEELERFSTLSSDSGECESKIKKTERNGPSIDVKDRESLSLEKRLSCFDDELERFSTISTDSSELNVTNKEQSLKLDTNLSVPNVTMKSQKEKQPGNPFTDTEQIPDNGYRQSNQEGKSERQTLENRDITMNVGNLPEESIFILTLKKEHAYSMDKNNENPSFEIENFEEEPYSRKRHTTNSYKIESAEGKVSGQRSDEIEMDFFKKPKLISDFENNSGSKEGSLGKQKFTDKGKVKEKEVTSGVYHEIKDKLTLEQSENEPPSLVPSNSNEEVKCGAGNDVTENSNWQNNTSEATMRSESQDVNTIPNIVNTDAETPSRCYVDRKEKPNHDIRSVRKRLEFIPAATNLLTDDTVPIIKGSKVFVEANSEPITENKRKLDYTASPNEDKMSITYKHVVKEQLPDSPLRHSEHDSPKVIDRINESCGFERILLSDDTLNLDKTDNNTILGILGTPVSSIKTEDSKPYAFSSKVVLGNGKKIQTKEQKPLVIEGSKVFQGKEEGEIEKVENSDSMVTNVVANSESVVNKAHESCSSLGDKCRTGLKDSKNNSLNTSEGTEESPLGKTYKHHHKQRGCDENVTASVEVSSTANNLIMTVRSDNSRDDISDRQVDASFDSTTSSLSQISECSKPKRKVSPGVIHMLNPCPSGWIEGGLKTYSRKKPGKKTKKRSKYTVSVLDFNPKALPRSTISSVSVLDSDIISSPLNNVEVNKSDSNTACDGNSFKGSKILENAKQTDLLCKRMWKKYIKDGSINIQEDVGNGGKNNDDTNMNKSKFSGATKEMVDKLNDCTSGDSAAETCPNTPNKPNTVCKDDDCTLEIGNMIVERDNPTINMPILDKNIFQDQQHLEKAKETTDLCFKSNGILGNEEQPQFVDEKLGAMGGQCETDFVPRHKTELKTNSLSLKDEGNWHLEHYNDKQSLQTKLETLGLGEVEIDKDAICQQTLDFSKIDYNIEGRSDSESEPSETDSESGDEIELVSFEMPGLLVDSELHESGRSVIESEQCSNFDDTQQFAIDCSFEDIKSYKMSDKKLEQDGMSILCECNFENSGQTQGVFCALHESASGNGNARECFRVPEIIDESPHVPSRSNLKTKAKSDSNLLTRRVRFEENLPVYKSSSNIDSQKHIFVNKRTDDNEEQNLSYIEDFITCMFEDEPRNIGLNHSSLDNVSSFIEISDEEPPSKGKSNYFDSQRKCLPKIVKPVSGKKSALIKVSTQLSANTSSPVVIINDKSKDDDKTAAKLNPQHIETIDSVPKILFTSPTGDITCSDDQNAKIEKTAFSRKCSKPAAVLQFDESDSKLQDDYYNSCTFAESKEDDQNEDVVTAYSTVCIAELKAHSTSPDAKVERSQRKQDSSHQNESIYKDEVPNVSNSNGHIQEYKNNSSKPEHKTLETVEFSEMPYSSDSQYVIDCGTEDGVTKDMKVPHTGTPREEITRYTFTLNEDSDTECPKIKTVTYEYVTEYKLNNVKIQYQQNRKTQTDKAIGDVIDTVNKDERIMYGNMKPTDKQDKKNEQSNKSDTKIISEEVIEKAVCYPLGPSQNKPSCEESDDESSEGEIEKSVNVINQPKYIVTRNPGLKTENNTVGEDVNVGMGNTAIEGSLKKSEMETPNSDRDLNNKIQSLTASPKSSSLNDLKIIEHDSKKYVWKSFLTNIPYQHPSRTQLSKDNLDREADLKRNWTLCYELDDEKCSGNDTTRDGSIEVDSEILANSSSDVEEIGRNIDKEKHDAGYFVEEKLQGKERLRQFCKRKLLRRHGHVRETFPNDTEEKTECGGEDIELCSGSVPDKTDTAEKFVKRIACTSTDSLREYHEHSGEVGEASNDNETMYTALMQERLPEIVIHGHDDEAMRVAQAVAIIALGTVLVFLLPYMG